MSNYGTFPHIERRSTCTPSSCLHSLSLLPDTPFLDWYSSLNTLGQILFPALLAIVLIGGAVVVASSGSAPHGEQTLLTDQDIQELRQDLPPAWRP